MTTSACSAFPASSNTSGSPASVAQISQPNFGNAVTSGSQQTLASDNFDLADGPVPILSPDSLHAPTDQSPSEFPLPGPINIIPNVELRGSIDVRYRNADSGRKHGAYLNAAELDFNREFRENRQYKGSLVLQLISEQPPDVAQSSGVQLGQVYAQYRLPIQTDTSSTVYFRAGQFQLPFGLLATYDPHRLIQQPLYAQSLGVRTDWGIGVSGRFYGYLNYDFAITTGNGPDHVQFSPRRVFTFRLGRTFVTRNGLVNVGGSMLSGRLPDTSLDAENLFAVELPASGRVTLGRGVGPIDKTRIAVDGTYIFKGTTARGEAISGADHDHRVFGYYGEAEYRFSRRAATITSYSFWKYPIGNSTASRAAAGISYAPQQNTTLRVLYEYLRDVPTNIHGTVRHRFTVQALFRF